MSYPRYPRYKDSGVDWLGQVPEHWNVVPIKSRFQIVSGSTPKSDVAEYWGGAIKWATPADLSASSSVLLETGRSLTASGLASCGASVVPSGSIILSTRAPIGSLAIAGTEMCTNQGCKALVPLDGASAAYYAYHLGTCTSQLNLQGKGTTFLELSSDALGAFRVVAPRLEEQRAITEFLDTATSRIDALIGEQQRLIELLKEKRQAIISYAVTKSLNPDVPMKPSGVEWLGELPLHWEIRSLSSITTKITNGYVGPTRDILAEDGVRYLQSLHIKNNRIRFDNPYFVSKAWSDSHRKSILEAGDVLVVQTGDIGQVAVVSPEFAGCNCHALIILAPLRVEVRGEWIAAILNAEYGYHSLLAIQTGALHPHLNCGNVKNLLIPVPPLEEQEAIEQFIQERCRELDELVLKTRQAVCLLAERRTALISAVVTGKIDVRNLNVSAEPLAAIAS